MDHNILLKKINKKLKNNEFTIGSWIQIPSSETTEIMSFSGYDWLAVDMEHGAIGKDQLTQICRSIERGNTLPIVRVSESTARNCMEVLDYGYKGVILPNINENFILNEVIDGCLYPPLGKRGVGFSRSNLYGKNINHINSSKLLPLIIAQIENIKALNNLEEICKNKFLSAIFIGPYDLSASIGKPGNFNDSEYLRVEKEIISISRKFSIPFGKHITKPNIVDLKKAINKGYQFLAYSTDAYFLHSSSQNPMKHSD